MSDKSIHQSQSIDSNFWIKCILQAINYLNVLFLGEVALPGGKVEEADGNDIETALREAEEEIGLDRSLVDVVAVLESFTTKVMHLSSLASFN